MNDEEEVSALYCCSELGAHSVFVFLITDDRQLILIIEDANHPRPKR